MRPEAIARGVLVRLGRLPQAAQTMARALAVLDSDTDLRHAGALARQGDTEAGEAADHLAAAGFLQPTRPLRFTHPLIRSVIYGELPASERAQAHRRAATILADSSEPLERVVAHLVESKPTSDPWVVEQLDRSRGRRLAGRPGGCGRLPPAGARRTCSRAPAPGDPPRARPGRVRCRASRRRRASGRGLPRGRRRRRARRRSRGRDCCCSSPRVAPRETIELLETVVAELGGGDPGRAIEFEAILVAAGMLDPSTVGIAVDRLTHVGEGLSGATRGERSMLCFLAYHRMSRAAQDAAAASDLARRAVAGGRLITDGAAPHRAQRTHLDVHLRRRAGRRIGIARPCARRCPRARVRIDFSFVSCIRAAGALRRGGLDKVEADESTALEITVRSGLLLGDAVTAAILVSALIERGELDRAGEVLRALGMDAGAVPPPMPFNLLLGARGRLRLAQGDVRSGVDDLVECGRRNKVFGIRNPVFVP